MRFNNSVTITRMYPSKVKPRLLYFAVEDGYLDAEDYIKFLTRWKEKGHPTVTLGGGVEDLLVNDILEADETTINKLRLGPYVPERVLTAARRLETLLLGR